LQGSAPSPAATLYAYGKIKEIPVREAFMKKRIIVDLLMLILFLVMMDYRLIRNFWHETLGTLLFFVVIYHNDLNRAWYTSLFHGRWTMERTISLLVNAVLIFSILSAIGSGVFISKNLPHFIGKAPRWIHYLHHIGGYLMLISLGFHIGLHWKSLLFRLERTLGFSKSKVLPWVERLLVLGILACGIYFSNYYSIGSRLFMLPIPNARSLPVTLWTFTFGYLMIISTYGVIAYYGMEILKKMQRRK